MHRFFIPQLYAAEMVIKDVDAKHISKVLRMQPGDKIQIVSDDGVTAIAEIVSLQADNVVVKCLEKLAESHEPSVKITLAQGLAKGEKMDFIIQKAVEMGASSIVPVAMEHSVVRLEGAKADKKVERWQKIAEAAAKQSKRDIITQVQPVQTMQQMLANNDLQHKIIAYECEDRLGLKTALQSCDNLQELLLIIGPEGGISEFELELARKNSAVPVSLGKRILRAETAGIVALSAILYETGDLGE
jgi:16S rRNA (uracil1498-N3)-methyltransferase